MSETRIKRDSLVITKGGNSVLRRNCIKIKDEYHEKDKDCFLINDKWISVHFNNITIDEDTGNYNYLSKLGKHVKSLTWNEDTKSFVVSYGYTSRAYPESFFVKGFPQPLQAVNEEVFSGIRERLKPCKFTGELYVDGISNHVKPIRYNHERDNYDHTTSLRTAKQRSYPKKITNGLGITSSSFSTSEGLDYTYGIEIETSNGILPSEHAAERGLNIKVEKDGSVLADDGRKYGGGEYITGVLTGDSGFRQLKMLCNELTARTDVNTTCSVHTHIGGTKFDDEFIVYMYILAKKLEKEMYSYMAYNRSMKGDKPNEYCRPLKAFKFENMRNLDKESYEKAFEANYVKIVNYLSNGRSVDQNCNRSTNHPEGAKCGYNKESARYCWLNLVPTYFDTRGGKNYTCEFRLMGETTSYSKVKAWLLTSMALVWFVENHKSAILNNYITTINGDKLDLTLLNILTVCYPEKGAQLVEYFTTRQKFFENRGATENHFSVSEKKAFQANISLLDIVKESKILIT